MTRPAAPTGLLVLAATPIGNTADASKRLRELIAAADRIAAEDTRKFRALARRLEVEPTAPVSSCFEFTEAARADELLDRVAAGELVLFVSDAGMPGISDPGYRMVTRAIARGLPMTVAPGPSAVLAALVHSGLASDRFCFEGFLPRRAGERARCLAALAGERRTMVFFEAPHRIAEMITAAATGFGPERPAAICRELTKTHEEVLRGSLGELQAEVARRIEVGTPLRGEIVVVVAGATGAQDGCPDLTALAAQVVARVADGQRLKDAVAEVATAHGVAKRLLYQAALTARG